MRQILDLFQITCVGLSHHQVSPRDISVRFFRYIKLLPAAVVAQLPYRLFKQNGTSERLLDMVRATEGDMQVYLNRNELHFISQVLIESAADLGGQGYLA